MDNLWMIYFYYNPEAIAIPMALFFAYRYIRTAWQLDNMHTLAAHKADELKTLREAVTEAIPILRRSIITKCPECEPAGKWLTKHQDTVKRIDYLQTCRTLKPALADGQSFEDFCDAYQRNNW